MIQLDRTQAPIAKTPERFQIKEAQKFDLDCGVALYAITDKHSDVLKIDWVYDGGVVNESAPGLSKAAISLLPEGTSTKSAETIAQELDYFGAYLQTTHNRDDSILTLYCLPKHLQQCLKIIREILLDANYPENEVAIYKANAIQALAVNEQKTNYLAKRAFLETVWGTESPYGKAVHQQDIKNISRETLIQHSSSIYKHLPKYMLVAGNVSHETIKEINKCLSGFVSSLLLKEKPFIEEMSVGGKEMWVEKPGAKQLSVRIGKQTLGRRHVDFRELSVVNMLLGGYFGSRLMANIREEKGLTYGIYSTIEPHVFGSTFVIGVELNKDKLNTGLEEIRKELVQLRTEPVSDDELTVVKNYFLGTFLRSFDGLFSLMSIAKNMIDFELSYEYYYTYIDVIKSISSEKIIELAATHLHEDSMCTVIAGEK